MTNPRRHIENACRDLEGLVDDNLVTQLVCRVAIVGVVVLHTAIAYFGWQSGFPYIVDLTFVGVIGFGLLFQWKLKLEKREAELSPQLTGLYSTLVRLGDDRCYACQGPVSGDPWCNIECHERWSDMLS